MNNISKIVLYVLIAITLVVCGIFYIGPTETVATTGDAAEAPVYTSWLINWAYVLGFVAAAATIVFAVLTFISKVTYDWRSVIVTVVSVAVLAVLLLSTYFAADTTVMNITGYEGSQEPWVYQLTNMCIVSAVVLAAVAGFVALFGFLVKRF